MNLLTVACTDDLGCSSKGTCDTSAGTCDCNDGYTEQDCTVCK
jgi:hypothetical protein